MSIYMSIYSGALTKGQVVQSFGSSKLQCSKSLQASPVRQWQVQLHCYPSKSPLVCCMVKCAQSLEMHNSNKSITLVFWD
jgi:hypothetical protein